MISGLYRHYKGGLYLGLFRTWESDNDAERVRRVVYLSLRPLQLDDRTESEFLSLVPRPDKSIPMPGGDVFVPYLSRFKRLLPPWQPRRTP